MKIRLLCWMGLICLLAVAMAGLATASAEGPGWLRGERAAQVAGDTIYLPAIMNAYVVLPPAWHEVGEGSATFGGISENDGDSTSPSMAIAMDGTPYIAWDDNSSGDAEIYIRRWDGSNWVEVGAGSASGGGISNDDSSSDIPSLSIAPDGTPYIAWRNYIIGGSDIYVRRWNGTSWEEVGAGSASGGGISDTGLAYFPSVVVAPGGTAYVAWSDASQNSEIYVRRWNGSTWEEAGPGSASGGGVSNTTDSSLYPSLAISSDGMIYVAWQEGGRQIDEIDEVYVRRWNGTSWEEVGAGSATGGGISNTPGYSEYPAIAIAPDGTPYVAWLDNSGEGADIYVRRWNGTGWEEVGAGSASGGGISNTGWAYSPSMAISLGAMPYVTWEDDCCSFRSEIYVRRWNGIGWEEVGANSASDGGVSNNSGYQSEYPSIAIDPGGIPYIVWSDYYHEKDYEPSEIYVRRFCYKQALETFIYPRPANNDKSGKGY